jgi:hypothetical protein
MSTATENSGAGQGAVLLDIGGDIGALVVAMPDALVGREVELRPVGRAVSEGEHLPHVSVLNRPRDGRDAPTVATAVFPSLEQGVYALYMRPDGPVRLTAPVVGGEVTHATW